jgi:hypothetical protein
MGGPAGWDSAGLAIAAETGRSAPARAGRIVDEHCVRQRQRALANERPRPWASPPSSTLLFELIDAESSPPSRK